MGTSEPFSVAFGQARLHYAKHRFDMEHPNSVTRPFFGIIAACCAIVVGCSMYFHDPEVLLWGFGMLLAAVLAWGLVGLLNFIFFPPLFRLLGRLTGKQNGTASEESHDKSA
jgi:hypothetical protein